ncbi:folate-binding protein YgfZ [Sphingobium phenoxybenzoativorans]|uniref:Folate-binding protein YgfZ n=1 Tax=Sphingobium phenoxybenzoativorans TaxID=1592790 RepID=A0A975Q215_9SPHN|nr:folate-binding protein YgfZ [Sphingobium phenoxybenzoativorans]QUT06369.1 folate-binding protein YgfZ [Sphingobium phenoxybenzoativorans]
MPDTTPPDTTLIDRAVLRVSGEEAVPFLQGLLTQDVAAVRADAPRWSGLLTPQGKALFDFILWGDGDDILIDCEADQADALARRLTLYRLRRKVTIARDESLAVHWTLPVSSISVRAEPVEAVSFSSEERAVLRQAQDERVLDTPLDPRLPALGHRWLASEDGGDASAAWRRHRLSLGVMEGAAELGQDQTLWLEANAEELNGVDYKKGCYIGQENTARMHYRNKVNRRLVAVPLADADEKRQRLALPDLGLSIELRRVEDMGALSLPGWLAEAIAEPVGE